jgi:biotin transporter BioY
VGAIVADKGSWARAALGVLAGLVLIHLGGLAQLAILTGDLSAAARFGTWPFLLGDLLKLAVAVPLLTTLTPTIRARL